MAHGDHPHFHHHHSTPDSSDRNIGVAFWLNLFFAAIELAGGLATQSLAIISDALHDFGDALSLGLGYVLQKLSKRGPTDTFSYGLRRLSLLSAFLSGVVISVGAVFITIESYQRFFEPREPFGPGMAGLAVFGIAVNGFSAWRLSRGKTHNELMLRWHLIEDVLGWVAVLIGSLLIWVFEWNWMDPLLAIGISLFVLFNVFRRLVGTVNLFLQANPNPNGLKEFRQKLLEIENVQEVHDVHFWSLDGVRHVLSLHAVLRDLKGTEKTKSGIRALSHLLGDCHITIETESVNEYCQNDCEKSELK